MPRTLSFNAAPPLLSFNAAMPPPRSATFSSEIILVIVISSAIIAAATLYFLLSRCSARALSVANDVIASASRIRRVDTSPSDLIGSLPAFTFGAVTGKLAGGDCAVCLSKFERNDPLRLLPLCCHAFHAECIDTWLTSNQTCPLCRSSVDPSDDEVFNKILSQTTGERNRSFRMEIGAISLRHSTAAADSGHGRSFPVGDFDYVIGEFCEVPLESVTHCQGTSEDKEIRFPPSAPEPPAEELAAGVASQSWLRDYVDRMGSFSFRSSGRFFTGSSRRSAVAPVEEYRIEEEIGGEFFRWLSGV